MKLTEPPEQSSGLNGAWILRGNEKRNCNYQDTICRYVVCITLFVCLTCLGKNLYRAGSCLICVSTVSGPVKCEPNWGSSALQYNKNIELEFINIQRIYWINKISSLDLCFPFQRKKDKLSFSIWSLERHIDSMIYAILHSKT